MFLRKMVRHPDAASKVKYVELGRWEQPDYYDSGGDMGYEPEKPTRGLKKMLAAADACIDFAAPGGEKKRKEFRDGLKEVVVVVVLINVGRRAELYPRDLP